MRRIFVAGNWKMNFGLAETRDLVEGLKREVGSEERLEIAVGPPFVYLCEAAAAAELAYGYLQRNADKEAAELVEKVLKDHPKHQLAAYVRARLLPGR